MITIQRTIRTGPDGGVERVVVTHTGHAPRFVEDRDATLLESRAIDRGCTFRTETEATISTHIVVTQRIWEPGDPSCNLPAAA